jgi:hypothetical protein
VGTIINTIEVNLPCNEEVTEPLMNKPEACNIKESPANGRLISYYHKAESQLPQPPQAIESMREEDNVLRVRKIMAFFDDRPVSV